MTDLMTLVTKEIKRFLRVWKQTLIPPVVTIVLYLLIFWKFIWDKITIIEWVDYINFIFPGLLMMSVIMASYQNTSSSFFGSKFQHSIEELFVSPISHTKILIWFCIWAVLRAMLVWWLVFLAGSIMADIHIYNYFYFIVFLLLSSILFALLWLINAIYAKTFDDISIIPSFVITPLIYLGWVFYSTQVLSPFWKSISMWNPILYMVNGLRYSFLWISDVNIYFAMLILVVFITLLTIISFTLLKKWHWVRS